jgi:hypothetical protein
MVLGVCRGNREIGKRQTAVLGELTGNRGIVSFLGAVGDRRDAQAVFPQATQDHAGIEPPAQVQKGAIAMRQQPMDGLIEKGKRLPDPFILATGILVRLDLDVPVAADGHRIRSEAHDRGRRQFLDAGKQGPVVVIAGENQKFAYRHWINFL